MSLYSECKKCGARIDDFSEEERNGYPKVMLTILTKGKMSTIDLCFNCRRDLMDWLEEKK